MALAPDLLYSVARQSFVASRGRSNHCFHLSLAPTVLHMERDHFPNNAIQMRKEHGFGRLAMSPILMVKHGNTLQSGVKSPELIASRCDSASSRLLDRRWKCIDMYIVVSPRTMLLGFWDFEFFRWNPCGRSPSTATASCDLASGALSVSWAATWSQYCFISFKNCKLYIFLYILFFCIYQNVWFNVYICSSVY